jgi:hypothetical protein
MTGWSRGFALVLLIIGIGLPAAVSAQGGSVGSKAKQSLRLSSQAILRINPGELQLKVGASKQASAYYYSPSGSSQAAARVKWSSSSPRLAKVSSTGLVTGVAPGRATVYAQSGSRRAALQVTVAP